MKLRARSFPAAAALLAAGACAFLSIAAGSRARGAEAPPHEASSMMNGIAESYVKLALALGEHEPSYIDAYFGPAEWRDEAKRDRKTLDAIEQEAAGLVARLSPVDVSGAEEIVRLRKTFLEKHLESLAARARMLRGERMSFDEESRAVYDAVAPPYDETESREALARLEEIVPAGEGSLLDRIEAFRRDFVVPRERLDTVFAAAIGEARRRTRERVDLPADESFDLSLVSGKSWGAYNWYKGGRRSLIEINTDLPTYIDSPVGLACHEGYPGHHVYNVLLETLLLEGRGWIEFCVGPLHCPQSPISEGTANYGVELAFPRAERIAFERDVLFPLAGLDPSRAERYYEIRELQRKLRRAENEAARRYLDGAMTADETAAWLSERALLSLPRAEKLVTFMDEFRSYVINYSVGYDLVKEYVESRAKTEDARWKLFGRILSTPQVPSNLR
jgi:hypothetical protein